MRFDFAAVWQAMPEKLPRLSTAFAAGGVSFAALMVGYVVLFGGSQSVADTEARTTTVAVAGPVFKPVVATPVVEERVDAPSRTMNDAMLPPPPQDARALTRAVQTALKEADCYRGKINGSWNAQTSAAMDEFTMRVNARLPVDRPDPVLLALLETHGDVSCASGDAPLVSKAQTAATDEARPVVKREASLSSTADAHAPARAEQLSYAGPGWERHATETAMPVNASVNVSANAEDGSAVAPMPVVGAPKRAVSRERRARNARKYRKNPSISREVRRSFRSIQRSMNRLF